ncbi:hypothetical protein DSCW_35560 [Desulfosarcina widdelii]|uniref:Toxin RelE n=1 Tax=Desulfosarcina widdelii TaxID=947919 RepID=A0A5K7Z7K4_9BACT|nr:type II toxin-antitoxin system RelE/ParE family toxin [Desulfosarcina widdelii]BBO76139.1 hypothetical protein DSCW_35560 [Desulfosarcina widdelii]
MDIVRLLAGRQYRLFAVVQNGSVQVRDFIDSIEEQEQAHFFALFDRIIEYGPPKNTKKFRHIGDKVYELKTNGGSRILCFFGTNFLKNSLILTRGFPKPKPTQLRREKQKTLKILNDSKNLRIIKI